MEGPDLSHASAAEAELSAMMQRFKCFVADCEIEACHLPGILGLGPDVLSSLSVGSPPGDKIEQQIRRFIDLMDHAALLFGGRREAGIWLNSASPVLVGERSPVEVLSTAPWIVDELRSLLRRECQAAGLLSESGW